MGTVRLISQSHDGVVSVNAQHIADVESMVVIGLSWGQNVLESDYSFLLFLLSFTILEGMEVEMRKV